MMERFKKLQLPTFSKINAKAMQLERWIITLEKAFDVLECTDAQKLICAGYQLHDEAEAWWKATKPDLEAAHPNPTWEKFKEVCFKNYFPERDYITRFNDEALEIKDLDKAMAFNALHNGVTNHDLVKSLALDPVTTMPQLLDRCYQSANMFDIMKARKRADPKASEKKRASEKDEKKKDTKRLMFSRPEDRNKKKYCKFHKDVGHVTEDCRQLKREIEDVIQKGHLRRYVKEDGKDNSRGYEMTRSDPRRDDRARGGDDRDF
ncbi:uncharacterized protein LOC122638837 [Telopea speciosissima]|uniref:uncharacterized protein LOC122638837 n=1 Tax=Telopea speciosissima TaxID=54955 RepID=UPI001CC4A523|nr:uncharacterized protein LOC122638837 [Telopea speciosissima]